MDDIDIRIIECLRQNARQNASSIAEAVSLSVSAVIERIRKLEEKGVISQYTVILDNKRIGKNTSAFISVSLEHPKYNDDFIESVELHPDITECYYITGDFDFIVKVTTSSTDTLTAVLNDIKLIPGVSLTRTLLVLTTYKSEHSVMPQADK